MNFSRYPNLNYSILPMTLEEKLRYYLRNPFDIRGCAKSPVVLSLFPAAGEHLDNYLKMKDNVLNIAYQESTDNANYSFPFLPLEQPVTSIKAGYTLPSVLGVGKTEVKTEVIPRYQTITDKLPMLCFALQVKDSHVVEIPFYLGIGASTLPCMLVPYHQKTLGYMRKIYGLSSIDSLASYGLVTRYLLYPGTMSFAGYIGTGELSVQMDQQTALYQLSNPVLVDIRTFMGGSPDTETHESNMFWEMRMNFKPRSVDRGHLDFLHLLLGKNA